MEKMSNRENYFIIKELHEKGSDMRSECVRVFFAPGHEIQTTPMELALKGPDNTALKYLLDNCDVDVNERISLGDMPIHRACASPELNLPRIKLLLAHGASLDSVDARGMTPLLHMVDSNRLDDAVQLVKLGATIPEDHPRGMKFSDFLASQLNIVELRRFTADLAKASQSKRAPLSRSA